MTEAKIVDPAERFQNFLKQDKYRKRLANITASGINSLTVDFDDFSFFDNEFAESLLERPNEFLKHAKNAALD